MTLREKRMAERAIQARKILAARPNLSPGQLQEVMGISRATLQLMRKHHSIPIIPWARDVPLVGETPASAPAEVSEEYAALLERMQTCCRERGKSFPDTLAGLVRAWLNQNNGETA